MVPTIELLELLKTIVDTSKKSDDAIMEVVTVMANHIITLEERVHELETRIRSIN